MNAGEVLMSDGEVKNRATIEALVAAINAADHSALDQVFTEDVVMEWPQSGERIVGGQNRREVYSRFPSLPKVTPRRMTGSGDVWVLEANLDYGDGDPYLCVFTFEMRDGRIAKEIAYWSKPFPAPDWRAPWVDRI
jgi:ketosteroid isomerase-like protein